MKRVAVIGGGASGLIAAYFASTETNSVVVFEKQKKTGRKILVSGNGRCNITNRMITVDRYHGNNPEFVRDVFGRFDLEKTINFFQSIGIPLVEEKNGKMFPASLQSSAVVKILEYELVCKKVEIMTHRKVERICKVDKYFNLITEGKEQFEFDAVILAAGSCAYYPAGGSWDGYELAKQMNHTVLNPFPAILPINIPLKIIHRLQGIKWDCAVQVVFNKKQIAHAEGEILFTAFGISGPVSLDISRAVNDLILMEKKPQIIIDLFPQFSESDIAGLLEQLWTDKNKNVSFSLIGILKNTMPDVLLGIAGVDQKKRVRDLTVNEKRRIALTLKHFILEPGKPRGFNEAVIAAGGVNVDEIEPSTMESRIVPGLYITGELLDIDGDSGGYNLQFAWSTGAIAGLAQR